jgi:hypothetical protein
MDAPLLYAEVLQEMSAPKSPYVVGAVVHVHNISMKSASATAIKSECYI